MTSSQDRRLDLDRGRRLDHQERAYQLQMKGGIEVSTSCQAYRKTAKQINWSQGAIKYTIYGTLVVVFGHLTWPLFR